MLNAIQCVVNGERCFRDSYACAANNTTAVYVASKLGATQHYSFPFIQASFVSQAVFQQFCKFDS